MFIVTQEDLLLFLTVRILPIIIVISLSHVIVVVVNIHGIILVEVSLLLPSTRLICFVILVVINLHQWFILLQDVALMILFWLLKLLLLLLLLYLVLLLIILFIVILIIYLVNINADRIRVLHNIIIVVIRSG